jgi:ELWxxDGT repeat protein
MRKAAVFLCGGFFLALAASLAVPARAGTASLLADLQSGRPYAVRPALDSPFLSLGPVALVSARLPESGGELWATDGTEVGTRQLLDLCPGPCSSVFTPIGTIRQVGIFGARREVDDSVQRLWRSDGTRPGTFVLTGSAGQPLEACGSASTSLGGWLLFSARPLDGVCGMWRTDGTAAGTTKVGEVPPGSFAKAGPLAYFVSYNGSGNALLSRTDGTPQGTIQLHQWPLGVPSFLLASGNRLFFVAPEGGRELWTSDGTPAGTRALTRFARPDPFVRRAESSPDIVFQDAGGLACFLAQDDAAGRELWCSDGTAAGTRAATAMALPSPFVGLPTWRVERIGGRLVFPALDGARGDRWWTSDGRAASAAPLAGCPGGCPAVDPASPLARVGGRLFFGGQDGAPVVPPAQPAVDLWITDGTGAGTRRVEDLCPSCRMARMMPALGELFFVAGPRFDLQELWASDGTAAGTGPLFQLADFDEILVDASPATIGGSVLLRRRAGFWRSDGTPAGTRELALLARNDLGSDPTSLTPTPDGIRFQANNRDFSYALWTSRGTTATTQPVETAVRPEGLTAFGSLTLIHPIGEQTLLRTDGTAAGTFRLSPEGLVVRRPVVVVGSQALFLAYARLAEEDQTVSLWATDGTVAGTRQIAELAVGVPFLHAVGGLAVIDVSTFPGGAPGSRLWRTDGTAAGTRELPLPPAVVANGDIVQLGSAFFFRGYSEGSGETLWRVTETETAQPFAAASTVYSIGSLVLHGNALYFLAPRAASPSGEVGLFRSDGTEAGTVLLLTAPPPASASLDEARFTSAGGFLFFVLEDERGRELWRTDGTRAGTFLLRDIVPAAASSEPRFLTALGGELFFSALGVGTGIELWESDGTPAGTHIVQDIGPGGLSSTPQELVASAGRLFFTADDGVHGREPWIYTPGGTACTATGTALCLGGQFVVETDWRLPDGRNGRGRAVGLTADTGYFSFFDPANVEVILKVLDGRGLNDHRWVFYGALSDVEYAVTVTDVASGAVRRYVNPPGRLGSVADTTAFGPQGATTAGRISAGPSAAAGGIGGGGGAVATRQVAATGSCAPSSARLCLNGSRFAVEARFKDFAGNTGIGQIHPLTGDTGAFWFFDASNLEVVVKVLDGRPLNGKFWVFYGALSTVEYTLTVTDTQTGVVKVYTNPLGRLASVADTAAF